MLINSEEKARDAIIYSYTKSINGFAANLEEKDAEQIASKFSKKKKIICFIIEITKFCAEHRFKQKVVRCIKQNTSMQCFLYTYKRMLLLHALVIICCVSVFNQSIQMYYQCIQTRSTSCIQPDHGIFST